MRQVVKKSIARVAWSVLGRRNMVRLGRYLSQQGRLDVRNHLEENGEQRVQEVVMLGAPSDRPLIVFDVGANLGDWSVSLLDRARGRPDLQVHAFEPSAGTYRLLRDRLRKRPEEAWIRLVNKALSKQSGRAPFYVVGDRAGVNSLYRMDDVPSSVQAEEVETITLSEYCEGNGVHEITFLKIDTEGHDMDVMEGGSRLLEERRIGVIQFEYNHRWIYARHYLKDVFEFLNPLGYHVGKVTPMGIEFYDKWHRELESFWEGNYLAVTPGWKERFPAIRWWNEPRNS